MKFYSIQDSEIHFFYVFKFCEVVLAAMAGYGYSIPGVKIFWALPVLCLVLMVVAEIWLIVWVAREHRHVEVVDCYPNDGYKPSTKDKDR